MDRHSTPMRLASRAVLLLLPGVVLGYAAPAHAATWTVCAVGCDFVTVTNAIAGATAGDVLELQAETFSENVLIDKDLVIRGAGAASTTILAGTGSVVTVITGVTAQVSRLTIAGGVADEGAGVHNGGNLTLRKVIVTGGFALTNGGGIWTGRDDPVNPSPELVLDRVLVDSHGVDPMPAPDGAGGGVYVGTSAQVTILDSQITNNGARSGGGIHNQGTLEVRRTTISDNLVTDFFATGGAGAGIMNQINGTLDVRHSTISNNESHNVGGGLFNLGTAILSNTTVSGNQALTLTPPVFGGGGGLYNGLLGDLTLNNVTVTDNDANGWGHGVYNDANLLGTSGTVTLRNSVVAEQTGGGDDCGETYPSNFVSDGHNVATDAAGICSLVAVGDQPNVATPGLLPLGDYGGPTETHNLADNSPAIDSGDPAGCLADIDGDGVVDGPINADQRGQIRVNVPSIAGGPCDSGAVEYNLVLNGMMEDDDDGDRQPDGWVGTNLRNHDRRVCRPRIANNGACAMLIRGRNATTKELIHIISRPGGLAGDAYRLRLHYATKNANGATSLEAVVRFEDSANPLLFNEVVYALVAGTHGYTTNLNPAVLAFAVNPYDTIKVIAVRSIMVPTGGILLDDVSLVPF